MTRKSRTAKWILLPGLVASLAPALGSWAQSRATDTRRPIRRALHFLETHQLEEPVSALVGGELLRDYPGDWPQFFRLHGADDSATPRAPFRVRDVSPFMVAFIHHALTEVVEDNQAALGLSDRDLAAARTMRQRAVAFISRFESPEGTPDAGTFGFWPYDQYPDVPKPAVERALVAWLRGPILGGARVPLNLHVFPDPLAIPCDADVTATTYAVLRDAADLDSGPAVSVPFDQFFVDWRDLGIVPRRRNPPWLPPASGAFLTWLTYRDPDVPLFPNDVDLVVNANVLFALGRYDRLTVPGVAEAVGLINQAVVLGLHRDHLEEITEYYPDNLVFQYAVSRAFHEGGVVGLAPAITILADELESSANEGSDGTAYWDHGPPQLATSFAILTLLNAGRNTDLVARAVRYLASQQSAGGGFEAASFFIARADAGQVFEFYSTSFTTAMALEAFARYELARQ